MATIPRTDRLNELVKRVLSTTIEREFTHKNLGWVTISRVVVSKDMQHARIFFTVLGDGDDEARALRILRHAQPFIRSKIAHEVRMRYTPELIFEIDNELKDALRIDRLLNSLHAPDQPGSGDTKPA